MVVLFVVLTIILFITADYIIQRRKKIGLASQPELKTLSLSRVFHILPAGVFLQPSFTWSKILDSGNLIMGIHPILMGLIGEPDEIEILHEGESVEKGDVLLKLRKGNKQLRVKSPVKGIVTALNGTVVNDANWENISQNWLYMIKPENVAQEVPNWLIADNSRTWINEKYQQIKGFFMNNLPQTQLGMTMADGGDLPVGILSQFDEKTWESFEKEFISR